VKKTSKQARTTIDKIVKRYGAEYMRSVLEHMLTAIEADDNASWEAICRSTKPEPNFGHSDPDEAWEGETVYASFYEELTGRVAAFVVCSLDPEGEELLGEVLNGGDEGSIQRLLNNIRSM
jgi:hypothetical protein